MATETLFIVLTGDWGGDVQGVLVSKDEVLWGHVSSNEDWLERDLTTSFSTRRAELVARFPEGYAVVRVPRGGTLPGEIAHLFRPR